MSNQKAEQLLNHYFSPRQQNETDLVSEVRKMMLDEGIGSNITIFDNDPNISFAVDKNPHVQRFKINTWLDIQYRSTGLDTSSQRQMILDNGDFKTWLDMFKKFHIPSMKALNLPRVYE